jgi:hypothetical protein
MIRGGFVLEGKRVAIEKELCGPVDASSGEEISVKNGKRESASLRGRKGMSAIHISGLC